jgi:dipeptidyl-peptidase-4
MNISFNASVISLMLLLVVENTFAQELFERWLDDDHFIMWKRDGSKENLYEVRLPSGENSPWEGEGSQNIYTNHDLSLDDGSMIQFHSQDLYLVRSDGSQRQLTLDSSAEKNARLSFDKQKIAYTKNNDLYVFNLNLSEEKRLTFDGSATIYNGWASWVYYEEILGRSSKYAAFWWSPDSKKIAFLHFNDAPVPEFTIFRSEGQHGDLEVRHYPKAGDTNPDVQFAVADIDSGQLIWIEENREKDQYSAWPFWTPDSKYLLIQELNRGQDTLKLVRTDPNTGDAQVIYQETQKTWVEFFEDLHFLNNQEFIIRSNRDGWYNLYKYDLEGNFLRHLTPVPWRVTEIVHSKNDLLYFYGTGPASTDRHFFSVKLDGSDFRQITTHPGWHSVQPSLENSYFFDEYSTLDQVPQSQIIDGRGKKVFNIETGHDDVNRRTGVKVETLSIKTEDGFNLPGFWILPKGFDATRKYPIVFTIYGGPDAGNVRNSYNDYSADYYANHDIIRIAVDHRASGKFGKKGMDYVHRNLGKWEVDDLISAVKWLRTLPFIDSTRVGITGGSYGGYVTCMALTYGAQYFTHGISLYPVTDWKLYDNVYTERYMDTPLENPDGYRFGSAVDQAYKLKGKLLIVHGMMDDNVHMQNTMQLVSKMQDLGKDFEMMMYPGERHGWGGPKRSHLSMLTNSFWKKHFTEPSPATVRP